MSTKIDGLVKRLALTDAGKTLFNPYNELIKTTDDRNAPGIRQQNLRLYLKSHAKLKTKTLWVYITPTFEEARRSGVPLANSSSFKDVEEMLNTKRPFEKATRRKRKPNGSPISTNLWSIASSLECNPVIWPAIPFYPHKKDSLSKKRTPKKDEIEKYGWVLKKMVEIYNPKTILAIGKSTKEALDMLEIKSKYVPHPRMGIKAFKRKVSKYC